MKYKNNYEWSLLSVLLITSFCVGIMSCDDDDSKTNEDSKRVMSQIELISGHWDFDITPNDNQRSPLIIFFDNGMFYEYFHSYATQLSIYKNSEPGLYTINENEIALKSLHPAGSFYETEINTKLIDISEESLTFLFGKFLYEGKRWRSHTEDMKKVEYTYRKDIVGKWSIEKWDYSENLSLGSKALAEFKDDGTFQYTIDGSPYFGIYSICEDALAIYDETEKNPFSGLFEINDLFDAYDRIDNELIFVGKYMFLFEGKNCYRGKKY